MNKSVLTYISIFFGITVLFVGMFYVGVLYARPSNLSNDLSPSAENLDVIINSNDHILGNPNAKVTIVEYSDLECPYCKTFHNTAHEVLKIYGDDVNWVFRHYPVPSHMQAFDKAVAAECAAVQSGNEGFWKFVNAIYARDSFDIPDLTTFAIDLGFDGDMFSSCLLEGKHSNKVSQDKKSGSELGISGTPGIIILNTATKDTRLIKGAIPLEPLKQVLDSYLLN